MTRAIGKGHRGRAVPRLQQAGLVFVVRLQFVRHALVPAPRLGNEHRHGLRQRTAGEHQQFQRVVEHGRVARRRDANRADLFQVGAEFSLANMLSRACIQLTLPRSVLISPLCARKRNGCARSHVGNVFVL